MDGEEGQGLSPLLLQHLHIEREGAVKEIERLEETRVVSQKQAKKGLREGENVPLCPFLLRV